MKAEISKVSELKFGNKILTGISLCGKMLIVARQMTLRQIYGEVSKWS